MPPNALTLDAALNVYRTATTTFVQKPGNGSTERKDALRMVIILSKQHGYAGATNPSGSMVESNPATAYGVAWKHSRILFLSQLFTPLLERSMALQRVMVWGDVT